MDRNLNTYPIPPNVRSKLYNNGFTTVGDLGKIGPLELAKESQLTENEALEVLETVFSKKDDSASSENRSFGVSALDILMQEKQKPPIPTFCQELDDILGGGIPLMKVTELCGTPGTGKTQMCLQLCTNVQIPLVCGGLEAEAVFIDTEGSFVVDRLVQIANATVDTCGKIIKTSNPSVSIESFTTQKILEGVHYFRCKDFTELIACINVMDEFLKQHQKVSLLIIDSISFHFRYGFLDNYGVRTRLLFGLSQSLVKIANVFNIAVVVTNQMTTTFDKDNKPSLVPALGESWGHACTIRLILMLDEGKRQVYLFKSPWKKEATAAYRITACGIRDDLDVKSKTTFDNNQPTKKQRIT